MKCSWKISTFYKLFIDKKLSGPCFDWVSKNKKNILNLCKNDDDIDISHLNIQRYLKYKPKLIKWLSE